MQILIAGDLVPTKSNFALFNNADINTLLGEELISIWNSTDIRIFNLEVPLTDNENPINKCGPNLIAPTSTVAGIKRLNSSLITLSNNHILDQGLQGLKSTQDILNKNEIPYIGAGNNLTEASKPYIFEKDELKIGIYACAENEFSIATDKTSGANPFDPLESFDHIKDLKNRCNYVIVLYHGGKEHYRYPSPLLHKVCRKMVQNGADLVICQHSHCIGCCEEYEGSTIVYGQGNFIFDCSESDYWKTSLLINVNIDNKMDIKYIPVVKKGNVISLAAGCEMEDILNSFNVRSQEILRDDFIEEKYQDLAAANILSYLSKLSGSSRLGSYIEKNFFNGILLKRKYNKRKLLAMRNYIECEAHRELVIAGLKIKEK